VIADIGRYSSREIRIASPKVGELRVTGIVFQQNIDGWLASLEATFPVRVVPEADGAVTLQSRAAE
jgi:ferric-dicitrate binding protein FerR (iron transport regulator)